MIAEVKLDMKNVVSVVVMQDTTVDGNNGLNKVMNNAVQMGLHLLEEDLKIWMQSL